MKKLGTVVISLILILTFCLLPSGCTKVRALTDSELAIVESENDFGLRLFQTIIEGEQDTNVFVSPLSVAMALGMTLNGAAGTTHQEMRDALELSGLTEQQINESYLSLIELLCGLDSNVVFQIANSIWYKQGFKVKQSFLDTCQQYFDAEINDQLSIDAINGWVNEKTNGKIEDIVDQIDPLTVMFLINAIYFNGTWKYSFDEQDTYSDEFYLPDSTEVLCRMMQQQATFQYFQDADLQIIDLPYGNEMYSMTVLLPAQDTNINEFIAELNSDNWDAWMGNLTEEKVVLHLPKFTLEYELLMNDVLIALGMEKAFIPGQADFSEIHDGGGLYIDKVKHKTYVEVDEQGTEAAAVTSVEMRLTSVDDPITMRINRPFIFVIRESYSGSILFMGKMVDPS